jgi:hypothetical protein
VDRIHGYAVAKSTNMTGARKIATKVPIPCASHCNFGDVRSKKPTRKSPVKSAAWLAQMLARAPPKRLSRCAWGTVHSGPLVVEPRIIWEAFDAAVKGVMSDAR